MSPTVSLSGLSITAALGELPYAQSIEGWGRDEWGTGNWGENTTTVIIDGLEMTSLQGPSGWGQAPWDEMIGWGGDLRCETTQLSIAALTGIEATWKRRYSYFHFRYDFLISLDQLKWEQD